MEYLVSKILDWLNMVLAALSVAELLKLVLVVLGMLLASYAWRRVLVFLQNTAKLTSGVVDDAFLHAINRPARALIWFVGLFVMIEIIATSHLNPIWTERTMQSGIIVLLGWFLIGLTRQYTRMRFDAADRRDTDVDVDLYQAVSRVVQFTIIVLLGIFLMQIFDISVTGILTFGGVGGLVVGFAAKDMLENFFGGLMLHMDRPFKTGDWIRSPDRNIEGTVERIGWRQTLIRTHSRNALYIPNGMFLTIVIENPGRMSHRMIKAVVGLRYEDMGRMRPVVEEVQKYLEDSDDFDPEMPRLVRFNAFNNSSIDFFVQCYTREVQRVQYTNIKQNLLYAIAEIVARHDADFAFPTQTVHLQSDPS